MGTKSLGAAAFVSNAISDSQTAAQESEKEASTATRTAAAAITGYATVAIGMAAVQTSGRSTAITKEANAAALT